MLTVPKQQYIKLLREIEGCHISDIAKRAGVNWRTAKKYADQENWTPAVGRRGCRRSVMDKFQDIVDTWLIEDRQLPRKQRHSAARIYTRLQEEYGFVGAARTVRSYVSHRKRELAFDEAQAYQRLDHPGGEAQVDFCTIQVSKEGHLLEYKLLVASFPFSNAAFVYPVPKENQECFLTGLQQIFCQAGGVPRRIWFDNLSAAVISIEKDGRRTCTDGFLRFAAHHRFDAVFCNANRGNEKGHVENKCGYSRRNWCVPIPIFTSHAELAETLAGQAASDRQRRHYDKGSYIEELWQEETCKLLSLPDTPYQVFRLEASIINKYGEVRFDQVNLPVLTAPPGAQVLLKVYWDHIDVLNEAYQPIAQFPRPYTDKTTEIPWKEIIKGLQRKPRSITHSQFVKMMPSGVRRFLLQDNADCRKRHIEWLAQWIGEYDMADIETALGSEATWNQPFFFDQMSHRLYSLRHPETAYDLNDCWSSPDIPQYLPDLSVYDRLHRGGKPA